MNTIKHDLIKLMNQLDGIEYSLDSSVYTLTDDEFETVFYVRDQLESIIAEMKWENS